MFRFCFFTTGVSSKSFARQTFAKFERESYHMVEITRHPVQLKQQLFRNWDFFFHRTGSFPDTNVHPTFTGHTVNGNQETDEESFAIIDSLRNAP